MHSSTPGRTKATKRATTDDSLPQPSKRVKIGQPTAFEDNEAAEQCVADMIDNGVDESKWITGKFKTVYPINNGKIETIAAIYSSTPTENGHLIPIIFQFDYLLLSKLDVSALDEFRLLLKGSKIDVMQRPKHTCTLPLQLVFANQVHIMWKSQQNEIECGIKTLNTWEATRRSTNVDNSWYSSGGEEDAPEIEAHVNSRHSQHIPEQPIVEIKADSKKPERDVAKQNKKRDRLERKRQKQEAAAQALTMHDAPPQDGIFQNDNSSISRISDETKKQEATDRHFWRYSPISNVRPGQRANVSGVVVDVSNEVKKTRTGEWMCYIIVVDQDSTRSDASGRWNGLKVNCFTKRHKGWLPYLRRGDVVILHDVKIEDYMGNVVGVGQHDRLRWAAYSPSAGEIYYGSPNNAPKEEMLAEGFGALFSPYYEPDEDDVRHCITLSDWWKKLLEKDQSESVVLIPRDSMKRKHRLLCETGPHVPPNGYFDCTVEVLRVYISPQGVHSLFATDYTLSPGSGSNSKEWPAVMNDYVIQFEMWDDAAQIAEEMKQGEYYSIKNARMRSNRSGYLEGKVSQAKITRLDEDDVENDIHFKFLLERKAEWNFKHKIDSDLFQLIQDAEVGKFFDCLVELVYIESKPHHMPKLYVTDYSEKSSLATNCGDEIWSRNLEGRIIKIMLDDEQKHVVDTATSGTILSVRKLRLKFNTVEGGICGILGGSEKLISPINVNRTDNVRLNDLIRRKKEWTTSRQHPHRQSDIPKKRENVYTRIRDLPLQDTDADRYQLVAKVVSFYPPELKNAFYQNCSSCNKEVTGRRLACVKCADFDHEFVQFCYQMFILIEDEVGDQIKLSISDKSPLFKGLKRANLRENSLALREFSARVKPLLGNLFVTHDGTTADTVVKPENPPLSFEIDTWIVFDGSQRARAFGLKRFSPIYQ